jgi:riboflavin kinase / FMN adenylyltransferase
MSVRDPQPKAAADFAVYRSLAELPVGFGPSAVAVGNFDGVHLGHREILSAVVADARAMQARAAGNHESSTSAFPKSASRASAFRPRAVAVTFDPHPDQFLRPQKAPQLLTPIPARVRLLAETGLDAVLVLPFDAALAHLTPSEFVERILVGGLGVRSIHEGQSFRFGHRAAAGVRELAAFGAEFGFSVRVHQPVHVRGMEVSSSAVRALIAAGDVRRARWMLGRPFAVLSTPARGRGVGTRLLVPTVNLAPYTGLLPAFGVYVTRLRIGARWFQSVTNVGNRPTFEAGFAVESHILNFEPTDLSDDTPLELEFLLHLRDEIKFPSPEALKAQILKDVGRAKKYFARVGRGT